MLVGYLFRLFAKKQVAPKATAADVAAVKSRIANYKDFGVQASSLESTSSTIGAYADVSIEIMLAIGTVIAAVPGRDKTVEACALSLLADNLREVLDKQLLIENSVKPVFEKCDDILKGYGIVPVRNVKAVNAERRSVLDKLGKQQAVILCYALSVFPDEEFQQKGNALLKKIGVDTLTRKNILKSAGIHPQP